MRRMLAPLVLVTALLAPSACAHVATPPPTASSQARVAFYGTEVIRALDTLRDFAVSASAQTPPLVSIAATRQIVLWHSAAISTIHAAPAGWVATVQTGLTQLVKALPAKDAQQVAPYVKLVQTVLQEVQ